MVVYLIDGPIHDPDVCGHIWSNTRGVWQCADRATVQCEECEDDVCDRHCWQSTAQAVNTRPVLLCTTCSRAHILEATGNLHTDQRDEQSLATPTGADDPTDTTAAATSTTADATSPPTDRDAGGRQENAEDHSRRANSIGRSA